MVTHKILSKAIRLPPETRRAFKYGVLPSIRIKPKSIAIFLYVKVMIVS